MKPFKKFIAYCLCIAQILTPSLSWAQGGEDDKINYLKRSQAFKGHFSHFSSPNITKEIDCHEITPDTSGHYRLAFDSSLHENNLSLHLTHQEKLIGEVSFSNNQLNFMGFENYSFAVENNSDNKVGVNKYIYPKFSALVSGDLLIKGGEFSEQVGIKAKNISLDGAFSASSSFALQGEEKVDLRGQINSPLFSLKTKNLINNSTVSAKDIHLDAEKGRNNKEGNLHADQDIILTGFQDFEHHGKMRAERYLLTEGNCFKSFADSEALIGAMHLAKGENYIGSGRWVAGSSLLQTKGVSLKKEYSFEGRYLLGNTQSECTVDKGAFIKAFSAAHLQSENRLSFEGQIYLVSPGQGSFPYIDFTFPDGNGKKLALAVKGTAARIQKLQQNYLPNVDKLHGVLLHAKGNLIHRGKVEAPSDSLTYKGNNLVFSGVSQSSSFEGVKTVISASQATCSGLIKAPSGLLCKISKEFNTSGEIIANQTEIFSPLVNMGGIFKGDLFIDGSQKINSTENHTTKAILNGKLEGNVTIQNFSTIQSFMKVSKDFRITRFKDAMIKAPIEGLLTVNNGQRLDVDASVKKGVNIEQTQEINLRDVVLGNVYANQLNTLTSTAKVDNNFQVSNFQTVDQQGSIGRALLAQNGDEIKSKGDVGQAQISNLKKADLDVHTSGIVNFQNVDQASLSGTSGSATAEHVKSLNSQAQVNGEMNIKDVNQANITGPIRDTLNGQDVEKLSVTATVGQDVNLERGLDISLASVGGDVKILKALNTVITGHTSGNVDEIESERLFITSTGTLGARNSHCLKTKQTFIAGGILNGALNAEAPTFIILPSGGVSVASAYINAETSFANYNILSTSSGQQPGTGGLYINAPQFFDNSGLIHSGYDGTTLKLGTSYNLGIHRSSGWLNLEAEYYPDLIGMLSGQYYNLTAETKGIHITTKDAVTFNQPIHASWGIGLTAGSIDVHQPITSTQDIFLQTTQGDLTIHQDISPIEQPKLFGGRRMKHFNQIPIDTANNILISGRNVSLNSAGNMPIYNSVKATERLEIRANGLLDYKGLLEGADVRVTARSLNAERGIYRQYSSGGYRDILLTQPTLRASTGDLEVDILDLLHARGASFEATYNVSLKAGRAIYEAQQTVSSQTKKSNGKTITTTETKNHKSSVVAEQGNAHIKAHDLMREGLDTKAKGITHYEAHKITDNLIYDEKTEVSQGKSGNSIFGKKKVKKEKITSTYVPNTDKIEDKIDGKVIFEATQSANIAPDVDSKHIIFKTPHLGLTCGSNTEYSNTQTSKKSAVWQSNQNKGHQQKTGVLCKLKGDVIFDGVETFDISLPGKGNLARTLGKLKNDPDMAWLRNLQNNPNVNWTHVKDEHKRWNKKCQGLTPAAMAVIAIATSLISGGTGGALLGLAANSMGTAMASAGFSTLVSQSIISVANNQGNLGKALKDLTTKEQLQGFGISIVAAGLTHGLCTRLGISHTGAEFSDRVSRSTVQTGVSSGFSAVQGADLGDSLLQGAINVAASTAAAFAANQLGQAYKTGEINTVLHKTLHAVLGAGLGAASNIKDPGKGALGGATAALAEAIMEQLPETLSLDTRVNISILSSASVALLTQQDVNAAGLASTNAIQNNFCEPPLSKEELELQSEAIKSVAKAVTTEIPGFLSFRGDMHARVEDGFNFIQSFIKDLPFVEALQSLHGSNPRAVCMLPLPIQGMIYSRSISHLGVDLIMPVTVLDMGLSLPVVGQGLGMGAKSVVLGLRWGWSKGAQVLSNAGSRVAGAEKLVVQSQKITTAMDLAVMKCTTVKVTFKEGMNPRDFDRKMKLLKLASQENKLVSSIPHNINSAERNKLTREYRREVVKKINSLYKNNPTARENALKKLQRSDIDHKIDLQLGGENSRKNLKSLDSKTNQGVGAQISSQLPKNKKVNVKVEIK